MLTGGGEITGLLSVKALEVSLVLGVTADDDEAFSTEADNETICEDVCAGSASSNIISHEEADTDLVLSGGSRQAILRIGLGFICSIAKNSKRT